MVSEIIMPNFGANVEEGKIVEWYVQQGTPVQVGDLLFCVETTKGVFDVEAEEDGVVLKILHPDGTHPNLTVIGYLGAADDVHPN